MFVNEGKIADVFEPGMYKLETNNLPILSTLEAWPHGFESPFKAEVYFFNTRRFVNLKWGTRNPLMLRDKEFGAVRLRAFGTYGVRVTEPAVFLREIVGTDGHFTTDEITHQLRNMIVARFSNILGNNRIPVLDLAGNYDQLGQYLTQRIAPEIQEYGLELTRMLVENISLPPEVEEALDKRTSMGLVGDLSDYVTFQTGSSMEKAAENTSGGASDAIGLGVGVAMAQQLGGSLGRGGDGQPPAVPSVLFYVAVGREKTGPFNESEIASKVEAGDIHSDTLVWSKGMENWASAESVPAMKPLLANQPPPVPGE